MTAVGESILVSQLMSEALPYGIKLSDEQAQLLVKHLQLVLKKNEQLNLTRITTPEEAVRLHIIDSLLLARYLSGSSFIDIGTGAGFPGIPLGIVMDVHGVLLDSVGKKVSAVNEFIAELSLGDRLTGVSDRAESFAVEHRGEFSTVVARAVAPTEVLLEYASPLLENNGMLVVTKGDQDEDEASIKDVATLCGFDDVSRETFQLPENSGLRVIRTLCKANDAQVKLPRRVGMARKKPLTKK